EREDPVRRCEDTDADPEVGACERVERDRDHRPALRARPKIPCGRRISTRIIAPKPTATLRFTGTTSVDHSWTRPIRTPPASAPYASPMPPTITAAKMLSTMPKPRLGVITPMDAPYTTPASPARPPATTHV